MPPMLPQPFTIPIAAARLLEEETINLPYMQLKYLAYAGGRGIAFETHTSVIEYPF